MIDLRQGDCLEEHIPKCRLLLNDIPYQSREDFENQKMGVNDDDR